MNLINSALVIDLSTFCVCAFLLFKLGRLSAMHPATTYLFFHLWVVTKRLAELNLGAPLSAAFPNQPITLTELTRAALMFDLVLFVMTIGWIITAAADFKKNGPLPVPGHEKAPNLSKTYMVGFARIMVPLGLLGILGVHGDGATGAGGVASTALGLFNLWLPLSLMPLFYWYGPRRWLTGAALIVFWMCETRMGSTRWLILLPTVFFCYAYLSRNGLWWPPRKVALLLALMAAMTVGLVDEKGQFYYGYTMWPALFNYVPRAVWPDKPASDQWEIDISTKDRPMSTYGMTASLMGAAYVDLGYVGVVLIPFLFSLFLGWAYFQAFRCSHYSVGRFAFLVMACILFQPYRDGMYSFFIFNMVCMMPMYIIVLLHLILPTRSVLSRPRYPKFARLSPDRNFSKP